MKFFFFLLILITESFCDKNTITFNGLIYNTIQSPYSNKYWLDRNLGAKRSCISSSDRSCFGDFYQWGRKGDGHQIINSMTTVLLSPIEKNTHSKFILTKDKPYDWLKNQNNSLWQGLNGKNNPCPKGFRIPTIDELKFETINQGVKNHQDAFINFLKLPSSAYRSHINGSWLQFSNVFDGLVWSSSIKGNYSLALQFYIRGSSIYTLRRSIGVPVRCIKD